MTKNSPKLMSNSTAQIQEAQQTPDAKQGKCENKWTSKKTIPRLIIFKLQKIKYDKKSQTREKE